MKKIILILLALLACQSFASDKIKINFKNADGLLKFESNHISVKYEASRRFGVGTPLRWKCETWDTDGWSFKYKGEHVDINPETNSAVIKNNKGLCKYQLTSFEVDVDITENGRDLVYPQQRDIVTFAPGGESSNINVDCFYYEDAEQDYATKFTCEDTEGRRHIPVNLEDGEVNINFTIYDLD